MSSKAVMIMAAGALFLSSVTMITSFRKPAPTDDQIRSIVDAELVRREQLYVEANKPRMEKMLKDYFEAREIKDWQPTTIHEFYEPFFEIIELMGSTEEPATGEPSRSTK